MESLVVLQHEVQRKFGRCMLRLQQYERLLKLMVSGMAVAGPVEQLEALRDEQARGTRNRTLGTLVGMFVGRHLTTASADVEVGQRDDANLRNLAAAWASMRFDFSMSPRLYAQTKVDLAELVDLRNDLVHHLLEKFNISNEDDCLAASTHLDSCYRRIDEHYRTLNAWASNLSESQARVSAFLQSDAFENAFVHGVNLDGSVCWPMSSIVECLQEAEEACRVDGWVSLDAAVKYISKKSRDQVPTRYGCKSWRQVLQRSGQFELRIIAGSENVKGQVWYRSYAEFRG